MEIKNTYCKLWFGDQKDKRVGEKAAIMLGAFMIAIITLLLMIIIVAIILEGPNALDEYIPDIYFFCFLMAIVSLAEYKVNKNMEQHYKEVSLIISEENDNKVVTFKEKDENEILKVNFDKLFDKKVAMVNISELSVEKNNIAVEINNEIVDKRVVLVIHDNDFNKWLAGNSNIRLSYEVKKICKK